MAVPLSLACDRGGVSVWLSLSGRICLRGPNRMHCLWASSSLTEGCVPRPPSHQ